MTGPLKLLLVEDDPDDALLVVSELESGGWSVEHRIVATAVELQAALAADWDIVIADYRLPQFSAFEALTLVREYSEELPFLVVSGCIGEESAVAIMREGAADCINKRHLVRLPPAVARELKESENLRARRLAEAELARFAYLDDATGLPNRRCFLERVAHCLGGDADGRFAIVFFGFDRIRTLADTLGQATGEAALRAAGARLQYLLPEGTLLGLISGHELVALVSEQASGEGGWQGWVQGVTAEFETPFVVGDMELFVPPVVGISILPADGAEPELLLRNAKAAMLRALADRKSFAFFTAAIEQENRQRLVISHRLRGALARNEFSVHFQPQVNLVTGETCGLEALLRWHDAELGPVSPAHFIPIAEQSGEIVAIGEWVLREVCAELRRWRDLRLPPLRVAVNVSARQLRHPEFVAVIRRALDEMRLPASALEIEVTETDIMADTDTAVAVLRAIRDMGVTVTIDDFGTGYSSLAYLKRLPISTLKVDRSFILDVLTDSESQAIVEAVVALAHGLGLRVVAEGVETSGHHDWLARIGCEQAQGYLYSRPLDREKTVDYLRRRRFERPNALGEWCLQP